MTAGGKSGKRPTLRDVAELAGVDPSAVSRLINDDPALSVAETTRERILAAIDELDYRPNLMAKGLRLSRTWTVGFVLPALSNPLYESIVRGAQTTAESSRYRIVLGSEAGESSPSTFTRLLEEGRVDGLLIASGSVPDGLLREVTEGNAGPVVVVNRQVPGVPNTVIVDDEGGSRAATTHLLEFGHRKIAALIGPPEIETSERRRKGFESAMTLKRSRAVIVQAPGWGARAGRDAMAQVIQDHPDVTAVFASTLMMGLGAISAAHEHRVSIPDDLSLICLHDSEIAEFTQPPLTTVALPTEELGATAAALLIRNIDGGEPDSILVPGHELVLRSSTAGPPSTPSNRA